MQRCNYTQESGQWVRDIYRYCSSDRGKTCSVPVKTGFYDGEPFLLMLPDRGVLFVWCPSGVLLDDDTVFAIYHVGKEENREKGKMLIWGTWIKRGLC